MVDMVFYTDEIAKNLHDRYHGPGKPSLFLLHGLNTDSNKFSKPADFEVHISIAFHPKAFPNAFWGWGKAILYCFFKIGIQIYVFMGDTILLKHPITKFKDKC